MRATPRSRQSGLVERIPPALRGMLWMLLAVVSLSAVMVSARALSRDIHTFELLFLRAGIGFAIIAAMSAATGWRGLASGRLKLHAGRGLIHLLGQFGIFVAVIYLPLGEVTALEYAIPIFTALIAAVAIRERVGPARWIGIALCFTGVLMIVRPGVQAVHWAALVAVAGTFCFGAANVMAKVLRRTDDANQVVFYMHLVQCAAALVPALLVWTTPTPAQIPWIVLMGVGSMASHYGIARAVSLADVSAVAPMDFLRLPLTAFVAWLIWEETLSWWSVAGAALIIAATWWNMQREARVPQGTDMIPPRPPHAVGGGSGGGRGTRRIGSSGSAP